jgi:nucleotidyltransferase substrate binding protein (TIGR01987 family)
MNTELDLTSLKDALASLRRGLDRFGQAPHDEELRDACIQRFEYCFELSWKMLARRLEMDLPNASSVDAMSYRELIRSGAERSLIADASAWMLYRQAQHDITHLQRRQGRGCCNHNPRI